MLHLLRSLLLFLQRLFERTELLLEFLPVFAFLEVPSGSFLIPSFLQLGLMLLSFLHLLCESFLECAFLFRTDLCFFFRLECLMFPHTFKRFLQGVLPFLGLVFLFGKCGIEQLLSLFHLLLQLRCSLLVFCPLLFEGFLERAFHTFCASCCCHKFLS